MERRNTVQREIVLDAVRRLRGHVTAEEVYSLIHREHPSIGKGTVYRNLNILAETGEARRVEIPNGPDRYDHTLVEHYHVRCVRCNEVFDVDMDVLPNLKECIHDNHGMKFLAYDILFKGVCYTCQKKEEKEGIASG